jgi:UDP-GlcNAc:undecaprenyl-phosphate/decaprenyl-phosphate GlcNAc-1-phosphate transferase
VTSGSPWILAGGAAALAALAIALLLRFASRLPHDRPGPRSLHATPMPRVGGLAVWAGALPVAVLAPPAVPGAWPIWLLAAGLVAGVSLIDDFRGVHPAARLAVHFAAAVAVAVMVAHAGPEVTPTGAWLMVAGTAPLLVWAANLYNFMDGTDGMAAAMGVCGFGAYGIAAGIAGAPATAYFAVAAAAVPFLLLNLPPARMFMGDVGAVPMGFLAAALGLGGWRTGIWPAWFPLLVFLPFIADATATLAQRVWRRECIWEAHRMHYYQRLHQLGAGHRGTLLAFGVLMSGTTASALFAFATAPGAGWLVLAAWGVAVAAFFRGIDYHWRHRTSALR